jgi:drug/metabolite transporter superfamily protein YnfA
MNSSKRNIWKYVFWSGILLITLFEGIRDVQRDGDFAGYVEAGTAVLQSQPLYENYLNTWPPFFSVFSVPLAWMDAVSPLWNRIIWFLGSVLAFGFVLISVELVILGKAEKHWKQRLWSSTTILAFLGVLRFYMDNLSNLQINMYLLAGCFLAWYWHKKDKNFLAGLVLAFCISLKVYPMFLMLFLPFIRKWRFFSWSVFFCAVFALVPYLVFGVDQATAYYADFYNTRILGGPLVTHRNQSLWSFLDGLLTAQSRGLDLRYNVASLSSERARMVSLGIHILVAFALSTMGEKQLQKWSYGGVLGKLCVGGNSFIVTLGMEVLFHFSFPSVLFSHKIFFTRL